MQAEALWAITSYFNPVGYRRRLTNYRVFRRRLTVPLVTVELAHHGVFELERGDAEILVQLTSPDILWHKERLLNVALKALPVECRQVAWLDGDDRLYVDRHVGFRRFAFDPFEDLAIDAQGCWRWNTPKEDMHRYVQAYFAARNEDGK